MGLKGLSQRTKCLESLFSGEALAACKRSATQVLLLIFELCVSSC